ncbi:TadE/TadG family type IV pilus assembly protein [Novosphingobium sp. MMS21-SN21R]|uniref:TadE/TadG family type IV pilus assembly protein n=1 Tax=Novosphingobium sp. MMS21-SN21R TaxID=2969298 RepID=UPI002884C7C4|nr:TadE/TadG family type IV pilus assembly protein [Novosphingobium sp. MMS21-SN21R]MDT0508606.1 TadE/TadG family type IV pilus assembly protein [Novosphingobium sp. MMS21-SN21R]
MIEFALIAPMFLLLIVGCLDLGQMVYAVGVLDGVVEKAARDSSLETGDTAAADAKVQEVILKVLPGADVSSTRRSYFDFSDIERPERWNDANNDGACSEGENYVDENNNGDWDSDVGSTGNGGANDVVMYTVTVRYDPIFALPLVPIDWSRREIASTAVRRNQPFATQDALGSQSGTC